MSKKIKSLRTRKGFSQEELAENTGLSLRTIQRIENGETEPRGDSLKKLAIAFGVSSDEIIDWNVREDKGFLTRLNLSSLCYIIFPPLGILVPLLLWLSEKDEIQNINETAKKLLNFQISWTILLFIGYFSFVFKTFYNINSAGDISPGLVSPSIMYSIGFLLLMYAYNLIFIIRNSVRINNDKEISYFPVIQFLK
jgi:transcriptional regulator with XRE-family HTH domain